MGTISPSICIVCITFASMASLSGVVLQYFCVICVICVTSQARAYRKTPTQGDFFSRAYIKPTQTMQMMQTGMFSMACEIAPTQKSMQTVQTGA